jgi:hypothetical protein
VDARRVSAVELFNASVARIEAYDPQINAVIVRDFERARAAATAADAALSRGEGGQLLGIPITVKEAFNVGGLPTTWGLPIGRNWRPGEDAVAVARLKAAGAVVLGLAELQRRLWLHKQPLGSNADAGRLLGRLGGCTCRGICAVGTRFRHQRLAPCSCPSVRRIQPQAQLRSSAATWSCAAPLSVTAYRSYERAWRVWANGPDCR